MSSSRTKPTKTENSFLLKYLATVKDLPNDIKRRLCVLRSMDLKAKQKIAHASALSKEIYQMCSSSIDPTPPAQEVYTPIDQTTQLYESGTGNYTNDDDSECLSSDASLLMSDNSMGLPPFPADPETEKKINEMRDEARNALLEARALTQEKLRLVKSICDTLKASRESLDKTMTKFHNFLQRSVVENYYGSYGMNAAAVNADEEDDRYDLNDDDDDDDDNSVSNDSTPSLSATPGPGQVSPSLGVLKRDTPGREIGLSGLTRVTSVPKKSRRALDSDDNRIESYDSNDNDSDDFESDIAGDGSGNDDENDDFEEDVKIKSLVSSTLGSHKRKAHSHNTRFRKLQSNGARSGSSTPLLGLAEAPPIKTSRSPRLTPLSSNKALAPPSTKKALLAEAASRAEETRETYCTCGRPSEGNMICCDDPDCEIQWYHFECVGIKEPPKGKWICSACRKRNRAIKY